MSTVEPTCPVSQVHVPERLDLVGHVGVRVKVDASQLASLRRGKEWARRYDDVLRLHIEPATPSLARSDDDAIEQPAASPTSPMVGMYLQVPEHDQVMAILQHVHTGRIPRQYCPTDASRPIEGGRHAPT